MAFIAAMALEAIGEKSDLETERDLGGVDTGPPLKCNQLGNRMERHREIGVTKARDAVPMHLAVMQRSADLN